MKACNCKKSNCLKKYCECFQQQLNCDPTRCKCKDCKNLPGMPGAAVGVKGAAAAAAAEANGVKLEVRTCQSRVEQAPQLCRDAATYEIKP